MTNQDEITVVILGQKGWENGLGEADNPFLPSDWRHERWEWGRSQREMQAQRKAGGGRNE